MPKENIFEAPHVRDAECLKRIKELKPEMGIAAFWGYILKKELFTIPPRGCINFHPAYLPYNRGMNPNVWPFIEGTPSGVSIHRIDSGVDSGDIIARRKIEVEPIDTGGSLYEKTLVEIVKLFREIWPKLRDNKIQAISQKNMEYTFHTAKQVDELDEIDLEKTYTGKEIINILRSRTYGQDAFSFFRVNGKKITIGVFLKYAD